MIRPGIRPGIGSVAVFCGSELGHDPRHAQEAAALGAGLAATGRRLVYGGGGIGLMRLVADAALAGGGRVLGVLPAFMTGWNVAHHAVADLAWTDSMHARKARIYEEADAFVALPGGIGTLDETIEVITWRQLRQHDKPILLCDVAGSSAPLVAALDAAIEAGFSAPGLRDLFEVTRGAAATLARLDTLAPGHPGGGGQL